MSPETTDDPSRWTVVYDGECGFCTTALALVLRADTGRRLRPLALGTPEADRRLDDLSPAERAASWHLLDPTGRRTSAGAAAVPLLRLLPAGAPPAALLARFPDTTERAYRFVAEHRAAFGRLTPSRAKRRATAVVARRAARTR